MAKHKKIVRPEIELEVRSLAGWLLLPFYAALVYAKLLRVVRINCRINGSTLGIYKALCVPKIVVVSGNED